MCASLYLASKSSQSERRVRAAIQHGHGGKRTPCFRPCCSTVRLPWRPPRPLSPSVPVWPSSSRCSVSRLVGVGADTLWDFELELRVTSHSADLSACGDARHPSVSARRAYSETSSFELTRAPRCPPKMRSCEGGWTKWLYCTMTGHWQRRCT
ncbi:hypothetical protein EDB89DRAFT_1389490 [Lactarius sanguifluus]|nr:hypothetical protein EDB89DRAFT_1389490 [Lactarius sanguifluus]